jgi:hypothetical protein
MLKVEFSRRYAVVGVYRDRSGSFWRVYPLPFVRVTIGR